jgi:hypothetical protein
VDPSIWTTDYDLGIPIPRMEDLNFDPSIRTYYQSSAPVAVGQPAPTFLDQVGSFAESLTPGLREIDRAIRSYKNLPARVYPEDLARMRRMAGTRVGEEKDKSKSLREQIEKLNEQMKEFAKQLKEQNEVIFGEAKEPGQVEPTVEDEGQASDEGSVIPSKATPTATPVSRPVGIPVVPYRVGDTISSYM